MMKRSILLNGAVEVHRHHIRIISGSEQDNKAILEVLDLSDWEDQSTAVRQMKHAYMNDYVVVTTYLSSTESVNQRICKILPNRTT